MDRSCEKDMDLKKFDMIVRQWVKQFDNASLSGVAEVIGMSGICWSASVCRTGEGTLPEIDPSNIVLMRSIVQKYELEDFVLGKVKCIRFLQCADVGLRWQIQWYFRSFREY